MLGGLVESLTGVFDELVALDGAYQLLRAADPRSPADQAVAIVEAAEECWLPCDVIVDATPPAGWASEVAKRNFLFNLVGTRADWLLAVDADEVVESCDPDGLRELLASTSRDVATVTMAQKLDIEASWPMRRIFRMAVEPRCVGAHYEIHARDGQRLAGAEDREPALEPCAHAPLVLRHRREQRDRARLLAQRRYYRLRDELQVERLRD
jgi:hypothetical protein